MQRGKLYKIRLEEYLQLIRRPLKSSGPNGLLIFLKSSDNFETALMTDNSGMVYGLKQTVAGSGIRLAHNNGVSIHFKRGEGVVEFVKDQPISITEVK